MLDSLHSHLALLMPCRVSGRAVSVEFFFFVVFFYSLNVTPQQQVVPTASMWISSIKRKETFSMDNDDQMQEI